MDVVSSIRECLKTWNKGGELECRNMLIAPHCNPSDPNCLDVLTTAYHTLLCATLLTWSQPYSLTPTAFVEFVQSVLISLPSSSRTTPKVPSPAATFGDHLVDMIWSVDTQLDELLYEARFASTASGEQGKALSKEVVALLAKAKKAQQNAENDKQRIPVIVKKLLELRIISPDHCRERLESAVLASVGLIQDRNAQDKKEIRTRTGLFYKQNKFNLLREQSEGYSKLIVELTSSLGPPHSPQTGHSTESYSMIEERARPVWEKVISLIGYFDLDPNRALDIILDVLSQHLTTHYSFFLSLLSFSPWCGSYRRPLPENETMDTKVDIPVGAFKGKTLDEILTIAEDSSKSSTTDTSRRGGGARVLAQVLGFKFCYYQTGDVSETTPRNLYLTAAILIREGFITLEDLYPHLSPNDDDMEKGHQEYKADVQSRIAGAKNSMLAMAAPLESGTSSTPQLKASATTLAEPKKAEVKATNQKVGLLTSLLAVGAIKPAIAIMSKFPWIVDAHTEVADLMIRIAIASISSLYDSVVVTKERNPSFTHPRARYSASGAIYPTPRKPVLTLWAPTPPSTNTTDFVFFFPDWADRVPISTSLDDLESVIEPLLHFVGLHVSRNPLFMTKFLRLGRHHLQTTIPIDPATRKPVGEPDPENPIRQFWFKVLRRYMLPALSLIHGNAVCTVEIWNIVRQYETTARWRLYGEWKGNYQSHPELRIRYVQADRESKGILRRLSHNTIDSLSGPVAKLAHSNPCIFFSNAVNQIMAYDNLANVVIQALHYVTNMGFDVLVFIILGALSNPDKERVKVDGVNTSDWLQSLASFTGMLFRRYSADLTPLLKYIVHQLHNGQTTEIIVLRELIWKMAGIQPLPSLSEPQMAAMAGGPALRIEAISSSTRGARLDPGEANLKGPQRLGKTLLDSSLALPLLIQVAQQRQACVYKAPNAHLKSLAGLYDATHGVLLQYLELLNSPGIIVSQDYATKVLPTLAELGRDYGICAPICMQIMRPVLNASLLNSAIVMVDQEREKEREKNEEAEKRLKAALTAKREPGVTASRVASPVIGNAATPESSDPKPAAVTESDSHMDVDTVASTACQKEDSPWVPELEALFEDIKIIAPGNAYEVIGPGFYTSFWQLSTYDLAPPASKYDEEGAKLRSLSRLEDSKFVHADRSSDRSKRSTATTHRTRRDRYNAFINVLSNEFKDQTTSRAFTIKRLLREKQHWFAHSSKSSVLIDSIIENCIQPRCLLSPMDADFCAQFIKILHLQGTPGFHTLGCYNRLLGDHIKVVLFSCSEYEARNYGRFLCGILRDLLNWHLEEPTFISENRTKTAGKNSLLPGMQKAFSNKGSPDPANYMKWPEFQRVFRKFHRKLGISFIECIQTGEFMHVYNAIVVLKEILDVFPLASVNEAVGGSINSAIDRLVETEERGDLKILARSYSASLKKKEADWAVKAPVHLNQGASASPRLSTSSPVPDRPRNTTIPTGPSAQSSSSDARRTVPQPPSSTPSAPRAQIASHNAAVQSDKANNNSISSTKLAMESIPRPEVVKRVRPDVKTAESSKAPSDNNSLRPEPMQVDRKPSPVNAVGSRDEPSGNIRPENVEAPARYSSRDSQSIPQQNGPSSRDYPYRPADQIPSRSDTSPGMPPPVVPSQTASAQELRETARQTISKSDRPERPDSWNQNGSAAPSPRVRSPSPSSRPGTRNASSESRASGGKSRSDPGKPERSSEDRRAERDSRPEIRETPGNLGRRDSLTHTRTERSSSTRDRSGRDGEKDRDGDREKDRGRERHSERDKDRDRDRDRERERERERDRDRDRDRHRRDDKDRDRDSRKERDAPPNRGQVSTPATPPDDRSLPVRPDAARHRNLPQSADDGLGKRRRPADDDPDRGSKRSSRKDGHRDDRSRRPADEKERNRDPDRRRKDRDGTDNEGRGSSSEKTGDKRLPDTPKVLPTSTPSGPRAMGAASDSSRTKVEPMNGGRDRYRDNGAPSNKPPPSGPPNQQEGSSRLSLRSRISDNKEPPLSFIRADSNSRHDDDRDFHRKRTVSDRDLDMNDSAPGPSNDVTMQAPKRPRINQRRSTNQGNSNNAAIAKRFLSIDPSSGERSQRKQE